MAKAAPAAGAAAAGGKTAMSGLATTAAVSTGLQTALQLGSAVASMTESGDTRPKIGGPSTIQNQLAQSLARPYAQNTQLPIEGRGRSLLAAMNQGPGVAAKMGYPQGPRPTLGMTPPTRVG